MKKIVAVSLLVLMVLSLFGCAKPEKAILGTWKHQSSLLGVVTETTYTFNDDGTGTKSNVLDIDFTYSFSGEKLTITTTTLGIETKEEYSFEFKGDELFLKNEKETIRLEKVE